ncbi:MAG: hypothetical protein WCC87_23205 [Candidatus Korobacteraceae bacterium]
MHLRPTDYVLWIATPLLQMGVLIAMVKRGLHHDYPYFFNYTILQVVGVPVLYIILTRSYSVYFYAYYFNVALSVLISFAVLQEIFKDAFRPYEALRDLSVILFRWSALVVLLVGVMWAINGAHKSDNGAIVDAILLAERSVRLMQCGLVFFLLLFSEYLGISRRSPLFGISLGFGLFAAVNMLVATAMTHHGILRQSTLRHINSEAYLLAIVLWLGYTLAAEPSKSKLAEAVVRSKDWNSALEDARLQPGADSLLDTMDRTVERLLYPREESKVNISAGQS